MQVVQVASFHQLVMEDHPVVLLILLPFPSTSPAFVPPLLFHLAPFFLPFIFSLCSCFLFSPPPLSFLPHNKLSKTVKILSFICVFLHLAIKINQVCIEDGPSMMGNKLQMQADYCR